MVSNKYSFLWKFAAVHQARFIRFHLIEFSCHWHNDYYNGNGLSIACLMRMDRYKLGHSSVSRIYTYWALFVMTPVRWIKWWLERQTLNGSLLFGHIGTRGPSTTAAAWGGVSNGQTTTIVMAVGCCFVWRKFIITFIQVICWQWMINQICHSNRDSLATKEKKSFKRLSVVEVATGIYPFEFAIRELVTRLVGDISSGEPKRRACFIVRTALLCD